MRIALIPARGGSKRIPRKNIREFAGRPILEWVVAEIRASSLFSEVFVSTDDEEIREVALGAGATVPFLRPSELADDYTSTGRVVIQAVEELQKNLGVSFTQICTVYPTAVFAERQDFASSLQIYEELDDGLVFAVGELNTPIERTMTFDGQVGVRFVTDSGLQRTQDLPTRYFDAGQFYWSSAAMWERWERGNLAPVRPYVMPKWKVHDIDTLDDWELAETVFTEKIKPLRK